MQKVFDDYMKLNKKIKDEGNAMNKAENGFTNKLRYLCLIGIIAMGLMSIVSTGGSGDGDIGFSSDPVWIWASWSGGARGAPNDRVDNEPSSFNGSLCPASSVILSNYGGQFNGLNIVNDCTITVTYAMCVSEGSLPQPQGGLNECATDPFDTPCRGGYT